MATAETVPAVRAIIERPVDSPFRRTLVRFRRHRLAMVGIVTIVVLVVAALAGYYRTLDMIIMRFVDVVMSFPVIVLLLIAVSLVGPGIFNVMIMIGLLTWTIPCRLIRGQFLSLRDADYVVAARVIGLRDRA